MKVTQSEFRAARHTMLKLPRRGASDNQLTYYTSNVHNPNTLTDILGEPFVNKDSEDNNPEELETVID
jgi:hypothetical protein